MQYAGIIGKNQILSSHELTSAGATITHQSGLMVFFEKEESDTIRAGLTKRGKIATPHQIQKVIKEKQPKIIGSNNKNFAMQQKRQHDCIKRAKIIETEKTDYDIKTKGLEVITLTDDRYLLIDHYQNIPLYEAIDIHKPVSGMAIGMMPSKLAHLLLSIGVNHRHQTNTSQPTIRDPFAGFGTTNMIANGLGYNTIGSDLNITQAKRNIGRRETYDLHTDQRITLRKHDVKNTFGPIFTHADVVVSEGRLGPIVTGKTHRPTLVLHAQRVAELYQAFFANIQAMGDSGPSVVVMTIPEYDRYDGPQPYELLQSSATFAPFVPTVTSLDEVYRRKKQRVGRRILVWKRK